MRDIEAKAAAEARAREAELKERLEVLAKAHEARESGLAAALAKTRSELDEVRLRSEVVLEDNRLLLCAQGEAVVALDEADAREEALARRLEDLEALLVDARAQALAAELADEPLFSMLEGAVEAIRAHKDGGRTTRHRTKKQAAAADHRIA